MLKSRKKPQSEKNSAEYCETCNKILKCVSCGKKLCKPKDDWDCYIEGHYMCPVVGIVCIDCEKTVKKETAGQC